MWLRKRFTIRAMMVALAIIGIGLAYARFAILCSWEAEPQMAFDSVWTRAQLEVATRQARFERLYIFAVPPAIGITLLIAWQALCMQRFGR